MCLAIPGRIESITDTSPMTRRGLVDFGGIVKEIHLVFVPEAEQGDYVLAHVGCAIATINEEVALRTLDDLSEESH